MTPSRKNEERLWHRMVKAARRFSFVPWARKLSLLSGCSTRSSYGCSRHLFCISLPSGLRYVLVHQSEMAFAYLSANKMLVVTIGRNAWRQTASLDQCWLAFLHLGCYSRLSVRYMPTIENDVANFPRPWNHLPSRDFSRIDLGLPFMQYLYRYLSYFTSDSPSYQGASQEDAKVVPHQPFQLQHLNHWYCPYTGYPDAQSKYPTCHVLRRSSTKS